MSIDAQNLGRVNIEYNAQVCKSIQRGKFVSPDIMGDRLLRYSELFSYLALSHTALRNSFG